MLNVNPPFMQGHQQPQGPPPPQSSLAGHPNLSFMSNHPGSAPGPSMLGGPQGGPGLPNGPFPLHMRQPSQQRPPSFVQQPHNGQPFNPPMQPGPSHMNGTLQSAPFGTPNMQAHIRRPPQQGQPLNPPMPGMGGQPAVGTVTGLPGVTSINGQNMNGLGMAAAPSLRPGHPNGMRMPSMVQGQGHLPDMNINSLHQPPQMRGPSGMISGVSRGPSHTFMANPPSAPPHPGGIQPPLTQFQTSINHTPNSMGPSPHVSPPHSAGPMSAPPLNHSASMPSLQANRHRMTPENQAVMAALPHGASHPSRLQTISSQFNYMHSSPPPNSMGDPSQIAGPSSQPAGAGGNLVNTPAQTLQQMNPDGYAFNGPSQPQQANALRPPSQLASHPGPVQNQEMQPNQAQQTSAMQQMPRPPSVQRQSPFQERRAGSVQSQRPPSRPSSLHNAQSPQHAAQPRTPRMSHPPAGMQSQPPNAPAPSAGPVPSQPPAPPPANPEEQNAAASNFGLSQVPRPRPDIQQHPMAQIPLPPRSIPLVLTSAGITRMLSFSGSLAADSPLRLQMSYWETIVTDYFLPRATFKFTLWKDNQRMEAKPFEIGVPILPRFFLVTSQSGVKAMHLTLDNARERPGQHGRTSIECGDAIWTFRYMNGYVVTLRGALTATMFSIPVNGQPIPKFETLTFDANHHDKMISLDAIIGTRQPDPTLPPTPRQGAQTTTTNGADGSTANTPAKKEEVEPKVMVEQAIMPAEPVNAFGIPQATMRCLELAESVAQMSDLIQYSKENDLGPLDALKQFANSLREARSGQLGMLPLLADMGSSDIKPAISQDHNSVTNASSPAYLGTPGQSHPQPPQGHTNGPQAGHSTSDIKPSKSSLAQAQASVSSPSSGPASATTPAAASTPGASSSTPLVANATLKRKAQADTASPTTSHDSAPPAKRTNRKRGKTQGG